MNDKHILVIGSDLMYSELEKHCLEKGLNVILFKAGVSVLENDLVEYANAAGLQVSEVIDKVKENILRLKEPEILFPIENYAIAEPIERNDFRVFKPNFATHINKGGKKNKSAYHNQHKFRRR